MVTSTARVTFGRPFRLGRDPRELPAGTYTVHTDAHVHGRGDRSWSVRADVVLLVEQGGTTSHRHAAPAVFDAAVAADAKGDPA